METQKIKEEEKRKVGAQPFKDWQVSVREGNRYTRGRVIKDREYNRMKIQRLKEEIKVLREEINKPIPKPKKPTKEEYIEYFKKSKKRTEEEERYIWVGGDEPNFEEGDEE